MEKIKEVTQNNELLTYGSTPYDDVFRTLVVEHKKLLLSLINEMFPDINYEGDEEVKQLNETYFFNKGKGQQDKKITDLAIEVTDHHGIRRLFHLECQSTPDGTMIIRMFEYDVQIAIKANSTFEEGFLEVNLPESGVLYLRSTSETPDYLTVDVHAPSGESLEYKVPIMKLKDYSSDEIIRKKLYFLIPFYLFNFESEFDKIETGKQEFIYSFNKRYSEIYDKLKESLESGEIDAITHHSIIMMSEKIIKTLASNKKIVKEEAEKIMGGQVLEYETKTLVREGIKIGRDEMREEIDNLYSWLKEQGRANDILNAVGNKEYQNELLEEYNKLKNKSL